MRLISLLIKPASSLCNLNCKYCFYNDVSNHREIFSHGVMKQETMEALIQKSLDYSDDDGVITYAFQGGEPPLAGLSYFQNFIEYVTANKKQQTIHYSIQTNGTTLNDEWITFFAQHDILVGISLDAYEKNTNYFRYDKEGKPVFFQIMNTIRLLKKANVRFNVLCVLTNTLSKHAKATYSFFKSNRLSYIQFISCMDSLDEHEVEALTPENYYNFYKEYYDLWLRDAQKGSLQSVNLFENIMLMTQDQLPYQCGMLGFCSPQFVVEANGDVYPCDFYVMDNYKCGNILNDSLKTIAKHKVMLDFLQEKKKTYTICENCRYQNICHGGCKRMNPAFVKDEYCGHQQLLKYILPSLLTLIDEYSNHNT